METTVRMRREDAQLVGNLGLQFSSLAGRRLVNSDVVNLVFSIFKHLPDELVERKVKELTQ